MDHTALWDALMRNPRDSSQANEKGKEVTQSTVSLCLTTITIQHMIKVSTRGHHSWQIK